RCISIRIRIRDGSGRQFCSAARASEVAKATTPKQTRTTGAANSCAACRLHEHAVSLIVVRHNAVRIDDGDGAAAAANSFAPGTAVPTGSVTARTTRATRAPALPPRPLPPPPPRPPPPRGRALGPSLPSWRGGGGGRG